MSVSSSLFVDWSSQVKHTDDSCRTKIEVVTNDLNQFCIGKFACSAAYAARYVAKNIVAAGLADKCEIQLSYAIGVAKPTSINVNTFGTGKLSETELVEIIRENFDLRPAGIIRMLDLRRPIYKQTAAYGHFGRTDVDLPWEKLDKVEDLKKYL